MSPATTVSFAPNAHIAVMAISANAMTAINKALIDFPFFIVVLRFKVDFRRAVEFDYAVAVIKTLQT